MLLRFFFFSSYFFSSAKLPQASLFPSRVATSPLLFALGHQMSPVPSRLLPPSSADSRPCSSAPRERRTGENDTRTSPTLDYPQQTAHFKLHTRYSVDFA